jgi:hypothetical protein
VGREQHLVTWSEPLVDEPKEVVLRGGMQAQARLVKEQD